VLQRRVSARTRQGLTALFRRRQRVRFPSRWADATPPGVQTAWERLSPYDQHHLIRVARDLESGDAGQATVLAGLLHDVGKAGDVSLLVRVGAVLVSRLAPAASDQVRRLDRPPFAFQGLHLLLSHAERGAALLEAHGMHARVIWLVRNHEASLPDPELIALQAADERH
jgi:hypothetical protein